MRRPKKGVWFSIVVAIVRPTLLLLTRRDWRGTEHLPREGGVILAVNHLSYIDPLLIGHLCNDNGRIPRFMAKAELFGIRGLGTILRGTRQIAVYRRTPDASLALRDAVAALKEGGCVVIYPEGTTTKDPAYWPMQGKTGVARLALLSGAPVVPVAQWGAQRMLGQDKKLHLRRTDVRMLVGPPVDLSDLRPDDLTVETLRTATDRVMAALRAQIAELRGELAPAAVFDPRATGPIDDSARRSA
ncbi:MAG: lysophospholipid acyltransferase family protein [Frankiaceae bacterium]